MTTAIGTNTNDASSLPKSDAKTHQRNTNSAAPANHDTTLRII
jgi:hypothetical protein